MRGLFDEDPNQSDGVEDHYEYQDNDDDSEAPEVWRAVVSNMLLFILITGLASGVELQSFKQQFTHSRALLIGVGCQFLLVPLAGFTSVKMFNLKEQVGIILLVITSSPGGSFSNWMCRLFHMDLPLSVAMTTFSSCLSACMLPLNVVIYARVAYGASVDLDWMLLSTSILVVLFAVALGLYISMKATDRFKRFCFKVANVAGISLFVISLASANSGDRGGLIGHSAIFYSSIIFCPLFGLCISLVIARFCCKLTWTQACTVAIEVCWQNTGIGMAVALGSYGGEEQAEASGVAVFYMLTQVNLLVILCVIAWKSGWTYGPANARFRAFITYDPHKPCAQSSMKEPDSPSCVTSSPSELRVINSAPTGSQQSTVALLVEDETARMYGPTDS